MGGGFGGYVQYVVRYDDFFERRDKRYKDVGFVVADLVGVGAREAVGYFEDVDDLEGAYGEVGDVDGEVDGEEGLAVQVGEDGGRFYVYGDYYVRYQQRRQYEEVYGVFGRADYGRLEMYFEDDYDGQGVEEVQGGQRDYNDGGRFLLFKEDQSSFEVGRVVFVGLFVIRVGLVVKFICKSLQYFVS